MGCSAFDGVQRAVTGRKPIPEQKVVASGKSSTFADLMDRNRAKLNSLKAFEDGKSKSHTLGYVDKLKEVTHLS